MNKIIFALTLVASVSAHAAVPAKNCMKDVNSKLVYASYVMSKNKILEHVDYYQNAMAAISKNIQEGNVKNNNKIIKELNSDLAVARSIPVLGNDFADCVAPMMAFKGTNEDAAIAANAMKKIRTTDKAVRN